MRKGLIPFLILFAMLFSGIGVPALAHGHGHDDRGALAMGHMESHVEAPAVQGDGQERPGDTPSPVVPHHHCSVDAVSAGPIIAHARLATKLVVHSTAMARLASRGIVPLIEPPAA